MSVPRAFLVAAWVWASPARAAEVRVETSDAGPVLTVDGAPFFVRGMNWDHIPVGQNYRYGLWAQDDATIERVLEREMPLLQAMGVNAIRQFDDIPARWAEFIFQRWGIRTLVNPLFGRYGLTIDGVWVPNVDYANPVHRAQIREQTLASVERLRGTPGVLMWLLGNENNYGLSWTSFEIGDLPQSEIDAARATSLYTLYGEVIDAIHAMDAEHPVAICNGDLQYLDLVARHAPHLDVFGSNVYRGKSAGDLYSRVRDTLHVPVMFTEFGADAFDARRGREDALTQATILRDQWADVYANARGHGAGNAIGGFVFQWADGWWKYKQDERLDVHDTHASWSNGGYPADYAPGLDNMNEEWFGIAARVPTEATGDPGLVLRPAYDTLAQIWQVDPYETSDAARQAAFAAVAPARTLPAYESAMREQNPRAFVKDAGITLQTYTTRDTRIEDSARFGRTEAAYLDLGVRPVPTLEADVGVSVLGDVAGNLINNLTWETRGGRLNTVDESGRSPNQLDVTGAERVRLYRAALSWETPHANISAFHRVGHGHWAYDGDVFGLYREAYYGPNIDLYAADVPSGVEIRGQGAWSPVSVAFGPQLWWGANPSFLAKVTKTFGGWTWTAVHLEDVAKLGDPRRSRAIPTPKGRATSLDAAMKRGRLALDLAGVLAGTEHLGQSFQQTVKAAPGPSYSGSGYHVLDDTIRGFDALGGRAKITWEGERFRGYALTTYRGLVADVGADPTTTLTGWTLRDHGVGNVAELLAGGVFSSGSLQVAPHLQIQRPLVGPVTPIPARWDASTGWYDAGTRLRNIIDDPFVVSANREMIAGELLIGWDPTPVTWWWAWDRDAVEDAPFAGSLDVVVRHLPTSRDASIGFGADGSLFVFAEAPPAATLWDATARVVATPGPLRLLGTAFVGTSQSTGQDARTVLRRGGDLEAWWRTTALRAGVRWGDWGPYDYYRTFNLTYPFQGWVDLSHGVTGVRLPAAGTRVGVRGTARTLDGYSPNALTFGSTGAQYELATYVEAKL